MGGGGGGEGGEGREKEGERERKTWGDPEGKWVTHTVVGLCTSLPVCTQCIRVCVCVCGRIYVYHCACVAATESKWVEETSETAVELRYTDRERVSVCVDVCGCELVCVCVSECAVCSVQCACGVCPHLGGLDLV